MLGICLAVTGEASNCFVIKMISQVFILVVGIGKRLNASVLLCLDPSRYCRSYWYPANFNA